MSASYLLQEEMYEEQLMQKYPRSCGTVFDSGCYSETSEQSFAVYWPISVRLIF
jgi:hypothetical protein